MPIYSDGNLNTTALVVPDLYIIETLPDIAVLNGVPTDRMGLVGTASWGPLNTPVIIGSYSDYAHAFGPVVARDRDMGTAVSAAVLQGASSFRCVRVSDGTDVAATEADTAARFTALYTGTLGNSVHVGFSAGAKTATKRVVVSIPGLTPEVFDNIPAATPAAFWLALTASLNLGQGVNRQASSIVRVAVLDAAQAVPADGTVVVLAGGVDGAAAVTDAMLVGLDSARTGMHALSGQGIAVLGLVDATDSTHWSDILAFAQTEGCYAVVSGPAGESTTDAIARKRAAGIDATDMKVMLGDYLWMNDAVNGVQRLVSPVGFVAGRLSALSPERTSGNKQLLGVIGSQRSGLAGNTTYARAELEALFQAGIDVVTNPIPRGAQWGVRAGHNSSTSAGIQGDNHPRMTNFIASTLDAGMGLFVQETITDSLFRQIETTLGSYMSLMLSANMLEGFEVQCNRANNPPAQTQQNIVTASVKARYLGINDRFLVKLQGGQTVVIRTGATLTNA